jgi:hypothetical protein
MTDPTAGLDELLADHSRRLDTNTTETAALAKLLGPLAERVTTLEQRVAALENTTEPPTPEPEPPTPPVIRSRARTGPPTLTDPIVLPLPKVGTKLTTPDNARGRDILLTASAAQHGQVKLVGTRNSIMQACTLDVPAATAPAGGGYRRCVELNAITGIAYFEGVALTHSAGLEGDAWYATNCGPNSELRIVNCEAPNVRGSKAGDHGDVIQFYLCGGMLLTVDGLYASTSYQGIGDFNDPFTEQWSLRRIRMGWDQAANRGDGGQLFRPGNATATAMTFDDVAASGTRPGIGNHQVVHPGGVLTDGNVTHPNATGHVTIGALARDLEFEAGPGYVRPAG